MVEIGPGRGVLTAALLKIVPHLHSVEIDRDLAAHLRETFSSKTLTVHQADALRFDFSALGPKLRIVGNLPYNISTPLLFHLVHHIHCMVDGHFMLQKEVVDRMVARPSTPDYGRLSVALQAHFAMERLMSVAADAFHPPPKVESALVRMRPLTDKEKLLGIGEKFDAVVKSAFAQRRKTLRNTLRDYLSETQFTDLEIDPGARAETLSVEQFARIARSIP